jgi:hypothetical protein
MSALYLDRWEPPDALDVNAKKPMTVALITRRVYGTNIAEWASNEAVRPDGTKRWRGDDRTPLERIAGDEGPNDFLARRLTRVKRKTMRKEESNLVQFFAWAKANGYLASVPSVELPAGTGVAAQRRSGRGVHIPLTPVEPRQIVPVMPEWSSRVSWLDAKPFRVRSFSEFMSLTGLRPATIERLEVGATGRPARRRSVSPRRTTRRCAAASFR